MREIMLTSPVTGREFSATIDDDRNLYIRNPIKGCITLFKYDAFLGCYTVPENAFDHVEVVTMGEAADILGVSRQRVSAIASNDVVRSFVSDDKQLFVKADIIEYMKTRSPGRPSKEPQ